MHALLIQPYVLTKWLYFGSKVSSRTFFLTLPKFHFSETREGIYTEGSVMDFSLILFCRCHWSDRHPHECGGSHFMAMDRIQRAQSYLKSRCVLVCILKGSRPLKKVLANKKENFNIEDLQ